MSAQTVTVVSWGGGVNSTAVLVGMAERHERPALILFADTRGEKPETYAFRETLQNWLHWANFPPIVTVANGDKAHYKYKSLEANCLDKKMLPSLAYGYKTCSQKWKRRPQDEYIRAWAPAIAQWERGGKVTQLIGYDAGEARRAKPFDDPRFELRYPLIEWGWDRDACVAAIQRAKLPVPVKSACFFCPASTKAEILALKANHPALFDRAITMERNASLTSIKGLGRRFSWEEFAKTEAAQGKLFPEAPEIACGCFDGEED